MIESLLSRLGVGDGQPGVSVGDGADQASGAELQSLNPASGETLGQTRR